jgi:hypothetical protein
MPVCVIGTDPASLAGRNAFASGSRVRGPEAPTDHHKGFGDQVTMEGPSLR